jgi:hypothetical protein
MLAWAGVPFPDQPANTHLRRYPEATVDPLRTTVPLLSMTWVTDDPLRWLTLRWLGKLPLAFAPLAGLVFVIWGHISTDIAFAMLWAIVAVVMVLSAVLMVYAQRRGASAHR